ncbi:hypothetical protein DL96DRAFT_712962 [Flagelloscypha sp. PMI_526]|nr:hypothetical protein DL96DRAFT_712962 [Flagelloscypha sp. PMI_526]
MKYPKATLRPTVVETPSIDVPLPAKELEGTAKKDKRPCKNHPQCKKTLRAAGCDACFSCCDNPKCSVSNHRCRFKAVIKTEKNETSLSVSKARPTKNGQPDTLGASNDSSSTEILLLKHEVKETTDTLLDKKLPASKKRERPLGDLTNTPRSRRRRLDTSATELSVIENHSMIAPSQNIAQIDPLANISFMNPLNPFATNLIFNCPPFQVPIIQTPMNQIAQVNPHTLVDTAIFATVPAPQPWAIALRPEIAPILAQLPMLHDYHINLTDLVDISRRVLDPGNSKLVRAFGLSLLWALNEVVG